jgi:hypothetical protein
MLRGERASYHLWKHRLKDHVIFTGNDTNPKPLRPHFFQDPLGAIHSRKTSSDDGDIKMARGEFFHKQDLSRKHRAMFPLKFCPHVLRL